LLLRLPRWREPAVLAAFPSSAADPALVTAVSSMLAGHPAGGGCVEGPLALPHQLATAGNPDWAAIRPVRALAACASPDTGPPAGAPQSSAPQASAPQASVPRTAGLPASGPRAPDQPAAADQAGTPPASSPAAFALVLVTSAPSTRQLRSTARALVTVLAAQQARADDNAEIAERRAVSLALVDASPDAVVISDAAGRVVSFNPAAERLTGYRAADAAGRDPSQLLIPERYRARYRASRAPWRASVDHGVQHGAEHRADQEGDHGAGHGGDDGVLPGRVHLPVLRADGTEWLAEVTSLPLEVRGEMYSCTFLRDVTELEQATAALAASEDRLGLLSALAPVGIAQAAPGGDCTFINERWCVLTGAAPGEFLGRSWLRVVHPDDAPRVAAAWARAAAGGVELQTDCRLAAPEGADPEVWVHAAVAALPERSGRPDGFLVALTNISARKRAEQDRDRLLAEQRAAVRSLTSQT
jgi:PAS domain S-box-containing protein